MKLALILIAAVSFVAGSASASSETVSADQENNNAVSTSLRGAGLVPNAEKQNQAGLTLNKNDRQRKLLVNPDDAAQDMAIALAWTVPGVGPLVATALTYYFDGDNPSVWDQVKDAVESMVTLSDVMDDTNAFESHMNTLKTLMFNYDGASSNSVKGGYLKNLVTESLRIHNIFQMDIATFNLDCVSNPTSCDKNQLENNYYLMEYAVLFAPLHLAILKDQYFYGHYLFCNGSDCPHESDIQSYKTQLTSYAATYQTYFDFMRAHMWSQWRQDTFYWTLDCTYSHPNFPAPGSTYKTTWKLYDRLGYFDRKRDKNTCGRNSCSSSKDCAKDRAQSYRDGTERKGVLETNFNTLLSPMSNIGTNPINALPATDELCLIGERWCSNGSTCKAVAESCGNSGSGKRRRRLDALGAQEILNQSDWEDVKETCKDEEFELRLAVDDHMFLLASPTSGTANPLCEEDLVFHRSWFENQVVIYKKNDKEDESSSSMWPLGTFHLEDIAGAHDSIENLGSMEGEDYHVVFNNCGNYILEFYDLLGIGPTSEMLQFAAARVARNYDGLLIDDLVTAIQDPSVDRNKMTDEEIILQAFEYGIAEMKLKRSQDHEAADAEDGQTHGDE